MNNLKYFNLNSQNSVQFDGRFLKPGNLVDSPIPDMPLIDAICTRRTARAYSSTEVTMETFEWLIHHSMNAPTACNEQAWKLVYINDDSIIQDLRERGSASFLSNVRQCFLLCYNRQSDNLGWQDHIQGGAAFITTFQLLAHSVGVGSCWIGHLPNKSELRQLFSIHKAYDPVALVSFGYYLDKTNFIPRKHETSEVIMRNRFESNRMTLRSPRRTFFRTVARYIYYKIPVLFRRKLKRYTSKYERKFYYEIYD